MPRIGLATLLGLLALACAPTSRTIQGRSVWHNVNADVTMVDPGHWNGPWKSVGVILYEAGQKGENASSYVETGTLDMVWKSRTELASCTNKSTLVAHHSDGSVTTQENTATCKTGPDGHLIFVGTSKSVSGSGRHADAQFTSSWTAYSLTAGPGEVGYSVQTITFTKPPK